MEADSVPWPSAVDIDTSGDEEHAVAEAVRALGLPHAG
jgi:hypothetical protein